MPKYSIIIEYLGTNYAGSQVQPDETTIQSELTKALRTFDKSIKKSIFSGRTDAGVHAKGQVVHFESAKTFVASKFLNSINGILPKDISVKSIEQVDDAFHAQKSAKWRRYQYRIVNRQFRSAWDAHCLLVRETLDVERMNKALSYLIGEHDFSSFKSMKSANPAKDCVMYKADAAKDGDTIVIELIANRFLYNMVRTIVGTLLMIEKNGLEPEFMKEVLDAKDRTKAGITINPEGLTLMEVGYTEYNTN